MSQSASAKSFGKAFQQEVATALEGKQDIAAKGELSDEALEKVAGGAEGRRH